MALGLSPEDVSKEANRLLQSAYVMREMAKHSSHLSSPELKDSILKIAIEGLHVCENHAKTSTQALLAALQKGLQSGQELVVEDCMWMLHKTLRACKVARPWLAESNESLQLVLQAMCLCDKNTICICGAWLVYDCAGNGGLLKLLAAQSDVSQLPGGGGGLSAGVLAAVAWVVHGVIAQDSCYWDARAEARLERQTILRLLVGHWQANVRHEEVRRACSAAVDAMLHADGLLADTLVEVQGHSVLMESLQLSSDNTKNAKAVVNSCTSLLCLLAKGSTQRQTIMTRCGIPAALAQLAARGCGDAAEEMAMSALGQLSGLRGVVEVMRARPDLPAVIGGGLDAIAELAGQLCDEKDLELLPEILGQLLPQLKRQSFCQNPHNTSRCVHAISSVLPVLATYSEPGQLAIVDASVAVLKDVLQQTTAESPQDVLQATAEGLARMALAKRTWREVLLQQSIVEIMSAKIPVLVSNRNLVKYFFWSAAALAGITWVMNELKRTPGSMDIVDAAFCTILDILDDDVEGDWALKTTDGGQQEASELLWLTAQTMRGHLTDANLQKRGCQCIGHLVRVTTTPRFYDDALLSALKALQTHRDNASVMVNGLHVVRGLLEEKGLGVEGIEKRLLMEGLDKVVKQALTNFGENSAELVEHAIFVLASIAGVEEALPCFANVLAPSARPAGMKGLFEACRVRSTLLTDENRNTVIQSAQAMLSENPGDEATQQTAALLIGVCTRP